MTRRFGICNFCDAACGLELEIDGTKILAVRGDKKHVFSRGHVCPKGIAQQDIYHDPDRIRTPMRRVGGGWEGISWDDALGLVAERVAGVQRKHGRDALGVYFGNPIAHKYGALLHLIAFVRGLRTRNVFSANSVDAWARMLVSQLLYGNPAVLPVPDIERTHYLLVLGANPVVSNGSIMTAPDCKRRLAELRGRGSRLVVVDPRRTETAEIADEHHFIEPGADALLLLGMLEEVFSRGTPPAERLVPVDGLGAVRDLARAFPAERVAGRVGIDAKTIRRLAREFASAPSAVCYTRMGTSVQAFSALATWLADVLNLATGNLDRPGGSMFNTPAVDLVGLARRLGVGGSFGSYASRVRRLPELNGEFPVAALPDEIETAGPGQIRALLTISGNPVLSLPNGGRLDRLLGGLEFIAAIDFYVNETTRHAHVILPPVTGLECDHYPLLEYAMAVRNVAHYVEPAIPKPQGALDDWEIMARLAKRIGREHGGLWALTGTIHGSLASVLSPRRMLDLLLRLGPHDLSVKALEQAAHGIDMGPLEPRLGAVLGRRRRIDLAPRAIVGDVARLERWLEEPARNGEGVTLVGKRTLKSMNSWLHNSPRLVSGRTRCVLTMHSRDASRLRLGTGQMVEVSAKTGKIRVPLDVSDEMMPGVVTMPFGWGHGRDGAKLTVAAAHAGASYNDLVPDEAWDEVSGASVLNGVAVTVRPAQG